MNTKLKGYADLGDLPENQRIKIIGHQVAVKRLTVGVALEADPVKIARYRDKLSLSRPGLLEFEELPGLVPDTVLLRIKPKALNVPHN